MSGENNWYYCVVGNIKKTRVDENGILRYGTAAFKGGTKVYLTRNFYDYPREKIWVLGLSRGKRFQVIETLPSAIECVRCKKVYNPAVLEMMYNQEFFDCWWHNQKEDKADAEAFVRRWYQKRWEQISNLAEELYAKSLQLKKFNRKNLFWRSKRMELLQSLQELQSLVNQIQPFMTDEHYSSEYRELISYMSAILAKCSASLSFRDKYSRATVHQNIWGFHNLPKAFLPLTHPMKTSPQKAREYFDSYIK